MSASNASKRSATISSVSAPSSHGGLSPMPSSPPRATFSFSKGHGAFQEKGGLKQGKTEIRPTGVDSVNANAHRAKSGGTVRFGAGDVLMSFVPRLSEPTQFRAIGTKQNGAFTSFPVASSNVHDSALERAGLTSSDVVDAPRSPRN